MKLDECIAELAARFEGAGLFYGHGTDNPQDEAFYLLFSALHLDYAQAETLLSDYRLDDAEQERVRALADRRIRERVPVAYLVGEAWFAGLPFSVNEQVLIPRSPIAELIAGEFQPLLHQAPQRVLDLCTGSGCIGIACARLWPEAEVLLADISSEALRLADSNIHRHQLAGRVQTLESDLFSRVSGRFDLIVSNPPYVSGDELRDLPPEYQHEPALGLYSDDDGLAIPLRILCEAPAYLHDQGLLVMEVGYSWQALAERLPQMPFVWLEFESGGEGVLALDKPALLDGLRRSGLIGE